MVDSILNFDRGISQVVWQTPAAAGATLPALQQLVPAQAPVVQQINRLVFVEDVERLLVQTTMPDIGSNKVLDPAAFEDAIGDAGELVKATIAGGSGTEADKQALAALDELLVERKELKEDFNYYRDMLIGG
jgi:hypothetical protein